MSSEDDTPLARPHILVVGAADTGRAPMTAALLQRLLQRHGLRWPVASAGVVGHDGDPAEPEARDAMLALGLDLGAHVARSLTHELAAARLLLAVDGGVGRVLRAHHPEAQIATLGGLAGSPRDIPDPFRMQVGAWLQYANEIEALLGAGLPRLRRLVEGEGAARGGAGAARGDSILPASPLPGARSEPPPLQGPSAERVAAVERAGRLLNLIAELPAVVDWGSGSRQIGADLAAMERPMAAADLAQSYVALLRATIALLPDRPSPSQAIALRNAIGRLRAPIAPADLDALADELAGMR